MTRKRTDIESALIRKGFQLREGDHHYFIYHTTTGEKTRIFTKTSHSHHDVGQGMLGLMARQCKLSRTSFDRLLDCPLSREQYENILVEQQVIELKCDVVPD